MSNTLDQRVIKPRKGQALPQGPIVSGSQQGPGLPPCQAARGSVPGKGWPGQATCQHSHRHPEARQLQNVHIREELRGGSSDKSGGRKGSKVNNLMGEGLGSRSTLPCKLKSQLCRLLAV